jgi:hypothetical protein
MLDPYRLLLECDDAPVDRIGASFRGVVLHAIFGVQSTTTHSLYGILLGGQVQGITACMTTIIQASASRDRNGIHQLRGGMSQLTSLDLVDSTLHKTHLALAL